MTPEGAGANNVKSVSGRPLFGNDLAGAAKFGRKVLQLGQAIPHRQHRLGIVDVDAWGESKAWNRCSVDIHKTQCWMIDH